MNLRPHLLVLNKVDLADVTEKKEIVRRLEEKEGISKVLFTNCKVNINDTVKTKVSSAFLYFYFIYIYFLIFFFIDILFIFNIFFICFILYIIIYIYFMHICIVHRIDLDFSSMRYIKIHNIIILILSNLI